MHFIIEVVITDRFYGTYIFQDRPFASKANLGNLDE